MTFLLFWFKFLLILSFKDSTLQMCTRCRTIWNTLCLTHRAVTLRWLNTLRPTSTQQELWPSWCSPSRFVKSRHRLLSSSEDSKQKKTAYKYRTFGLWFMFDVEWWISYKLWTCRCKSDLSDHVKLSSSCSWEHIWVSEVTSKHKKTPKNTILGFIWTDFWLINIFVAWYLFSERCLQIFVVFVGIHG